NLLHRSGAQLGGEASRSGKMPTGPGLCGAGALARVRHRQRIGIRMLNLGQTLRSLYNSLETLVVKLVGGGPGRASIERSPQRDGIAFLRDILMDGVVGEPGQGALSAVNKGLDLICGRMLFQLLEDFGGFLFY